MQGDSEVLLSRWLVLFVSSRRHLSRLSGCHKYSGSDPRVMLQASLLNRKCPACRSCIMGKGLRKITFVRLESSYRGESTGWSRGSDWSQLSSIHITCSCKASRHRPPPPPRTSSSPPSIPKHPYAKVPLHAQQPIVPVPYCCGLGLISALERSKSPGRVKFVSVCSIPASQVNTLIRKEPIY